MSAVSSEDDIPDDSDNDDLSGAEGTHSLFWVHECISAVLGNYQVSHAYSCVFDIALCLP